MQKTFFCPGALLSEHGQFAKCALGATNQAGGMGKPLGGSKSGWKMM